LTIKNPNGKLSPTSVIISMHIDHHNHVNKLQIEATNI